MRLFRHIRYMLTKRKKQRIYDALIIELSNDWDIVSDRPVMVHDNGRPMFQTLLLLEQNKIGQRRFRFADGINLDVRGLTNYIELKQWELAAVVKMPPRHAMEYDL